MDKWDRRFIELARHVSQWSRDPSTKVGAVVVRPYDNIVLGMGYNGFPRGVADDPKRYNDRPLKYSLVVHAEVNAILNSTDDVEGCTLYCWPLHPCNECAKVVVQKGIWRVVSRPPNEERWKSSYDVAGLIMEEGGVDIQFVDLEYNPNE